ncbi:MAG: YceD family protein [Advenella sp.]
MSNEKGQAEKSQAESLAAKSQVGSGKGLFIDSLDFVRRAGEVNGKTPLGAFLRLTQDLPEQLTDESGMVVWSLKGEKDARGKRLLRLHVQASPQLVCQRCLGLFRFDVNNESVLELVTSEADLHSDLTESGEIEESLDEKILSSRHMSVLDLVEDDLILSLPYVPRHESCPSQAALPDDELEKPSSPFAVLEQLKKR